MLAMQSLWRPADGGFAIPARPAAFLTGEGAEEGLGSLVFRFLAGVQVGAAPGVGRGGGLCRRALQHRRR
jgi:hypothetical protein